MSAPEEGHVPNPPSKRALLAWTAGAAVVGGLIVFGAVLPAEYDRDPLGIGGVTGLSRLWAPPEEIIDPNQGSVARAQAYTQPFRSDTFEIPLAVAGTGAGPYALEFKVATKKDAVILFEWQAQGAGENELASDFHGHTIPASPDEKMVVATYKKAATTSERGSLVAPFDGIHGWFFANNADRPVTIRLKVTGAYDLVPAGEEGNLAGIQPVSAP